MIGILAEAVIYLLAAVIAVPIASRLGLGSVLGYLIAGVMIGPVIGLVGDETREVQHFAEFGVVMMLFVVGLELEPRHLWDMRGKLLGLGGLQVGLSTLLIAAAAMLLGQPLSIAITVGLVLSLSSTAIVLQSLNEKALMKTEGGQSAFSVLLAQDIAVIPMLALIPLLALPELTDMVAAGAADAHSSGAGDATHSVQTAGETHSDGETDMMAGFAAWQVGLFNIGAVAAVVLGGHFLFRPLFRFIAKAGLREMFTAAALLLVTGIAFLMTLVGLSPALGTFLAGVVLATSEYRHELESDIDPFKGLLLGLFFITVGAGIDFALLFGNFVLVLGLTLGVMTVKALVLWGLALVFGLKGTHRWLFALSLAQAGEFGFVLLSFSVQNAVIPESVASLLLLVVALSMLFTPLLFILFEKLVVPRFANRQIRDSDEIDEIGTAIIAGHGRFGQVINRILMANGYKTVVLDYKSDLIDLLRRFDTQVFYGDATRPDLLRAAGLDEASLLVVAIDDPEQALKLIELARRHRPNLHIIARAFDRLHVYRLYQSGTDDIVREVFDSSVRAGRYALEALGMHPYDAEKAINLFVERDVQGIRRLAAVWKPDVAVYDNQEYIGLSKEIRVELEQAMRGDRTSRHDRSEEGWLPPGNTEAVK